MNCLLSESPVPFDGLLLESLCVLEIMSRHLKSCESLCGFFWDMIIVNPAGPQNTPLQAAADGAQTADGTFPR